MLLSDDFLRTMIDQMPTFGLVLPAGRQRGIR